MAQIFSPTTNTLAKASLIAAVALPALLLWAGSTVTRASFNTKVGIPLEQPIPFSHQHHAQELGIDCRYCHTSVEKSSYAGMPTTQTCMSCHSQIWTSSPLLEPLRQSFASGVPIHWNRVNSLPDFVYFDHSIHVNRGVNCNVCHGAVQQMHIMAKGKTFFMSWCLECHRHPENFIRKRADVFGLYRKFQRQERLTPEERAIRDGSEYQRTADELAEGDALVGQFHIKKAQLTDCSVCHR